MEHESHNGSEPTPRTSERRARAVETWWEMVGTLWRGRTTIILVTGIAAVASVIISLLLANWYRAEARLLLPSQSGSGIMAGALADLPAAAQSFLGGAGGDYARYLSILDSRGIAEATVEEFDLVSVYETGDSETAKLDAIEQLKGNVEFEVDDEYEHLSVAVFDTDPQRAADLTNFFVSKLNERNAELASASAAKYRHYIEKRYKETEAALDSVLNVQRKLQEHYGVVDLTAQGEIFYESVADLRLEIFQAEAEFARLLAAFGPDNSLVRQAEQGIASARRQYDQALEGKERLLPVPLDSLPQVTQQYFKLQKEQVVLGKLLEYIRPVLEEARFDEQRQVEAVQVVDEAVPPQKKAKPRRSVICILVTLSAFLLSIAFVLARAWVRRHGAVIVERFQSASRAEQSSSSAELMEV